MIFRSAPIGAAVLVLLFFTAPVVEAAKKKSKAPRRATPTYHGYKIAKVYIIRRDIFDTSVPSENLKIYRLANAIHASTKESVIRQHMLMKEGDTYDPALARETERALRRILRLRGVNVIPSPVGRGRVDVVVECQETWSTEPYFNFSGTGGETEYKIGMRERNLLGYGKDLNIYYQKTIERVSRAISYDDPGIFGTHIRFAGDYADSQDGSRKSFDLARPFYSSLTRWSAHVGASALEEDTPLYQSGEEVARVAVDKKSWVAGPAFSIGTNTRMVRRLGVDYKFQHIRRASTGSVTGPFDDREYHAFGPVLEFERVNFVTTDHIRLYDRQEDYGLGPRFKVDFGIASSELVKESLNASFLTAEYSRGIAPGPSMLGLATLKTDGRYENGWQETRSSIDLQFYDHFHRAHTVAAHASYEQIVNPAADQQLVLGGDTGLRGYPVNEFAGNRMVKANLEDRMFFVEDLMRIVSLGGVAFLDAGYAWPRGAAMRVKDIRYSAGAGLRFHLSRASAGHVLRLDVGAPLQRRQGEDSWLITFGTDQVF